MFKKLLTLAVFLATGCSSTSDPTLGISHNPSGLSSPGPVPSGLNIISYPNTLNCDPSKNQTSTTYYPGQKDFYGNVVPVGSEEVFSFTYNLTDCSTN